MCNIYDKDNKKLCKIPPMSTGDQILKLDDENHKIKKTIGVSIGIINKFLPSRDIMFFFCFNMNTGPFHLISTPPCTRDFPRGVKIQISEGVVNRISEGQKKKSGKFPRVDGSQEFLRVKKRKRWKIRRFTRISEGQEEKKMENSEG